MKTEITRITASGLTLLLLLPLGWYTTGPIFLLFFTLHILIHLYSVGISFTTIQEVFWNKGRVDQLLFIMGIIFPMLLLAALSAAPVVGRDALIHHLAVPKMWLQSGSIHEISWHEWSYYPMLLQLAYTGLLGLGLEQLVSLYHGSYLFFLAALLIQIGKERLSENIVQLGAILCLTTPLLFRLGSTPYVDLPLCVFGLAAFSLCFQKDSAPAGLLKPVLFGTLLGLMAGIKYNGLLFAGLLFLCYPFSVWGKEKKLRSLTLCSIAFFLAASPWYIKNFILTGNPIYPLFASFFNTTAVQPISIPTEVTSIGSQSVFEQLLFPLRMIISGEDDSPFGFDGILSPLFLFLFFAPIWKKGRDLSLPALLLFLLYTYTAIELSGERTRYLAPVLGIGILLSLFTIQHISSFFSEKFRTYFFGLLVALQIVIGVHYGIQLVMKRKILSVLSGTVSTAQYMNRNVSESLVADVVNAELPKDAKVYLLHTGNRYYLYDRPVFNSGYFSDRHILTWIKDSNRSLKEAFQQKGITHIAFHKERYRKAFTQYQKSQFLSEEEAQKWDSFAKNNFSLLFERGPYLVGEIK